MKKLLFIALAVAAVCTFSGCCMFSGDCGECSDCCVPSK